MSWLVKIVKGSVQSVLVVILSCNDSLIWACEFGPHVWQKKGGFLQLVQENSCGPNGFNASWGLTKTIVRSISKLTSYDKEGLLFEVWRLWLNKYENICPTKGFQTKGLYKRMNMPSYLKMSQKPMIARKFEWGGGHTLSNTFPQLCGFKCVGFGWGIGVTNN